MLSVRKYFNMKKQHKKDEHCKIGKGCRPQGVSGARLTVGGQR